jgi:hypothetical protein
MSPTVPLDVSCHGVFVRGGRSRSLYSDMPTSFQGIVLFRYSLDGMLGSCTCHQEEWVTFKSIVP